MKKQNLKNRIRGWFPQEPKFPKSSVQIGYQHLDREPWVSRNSSTLGLVGGFLTVLIALGTIFVGLIFSDALRSYNIYQTGDLNPQQTAVQDFVLGGIGLAAGILGIVGSRIGKRRGGIMLIIAGASALLFSFIGFVSVVLMLLSGATEIGKNPRVPNVPGKFDVCIARIRSFENAFVFSLYFAGLSLITFLGSQLLNDSQDLGGSFVLLFYPLFFIYPALSYMKKKNVLKNVFSKIFFASVLILIVLSGVFFGFRIITSTGFLVVSLVAVPMFTFLYAWVEKIFRQTYSHTHQVRNKHKIVSTFLVLAGIIFLVLSLSLSPHVEPRLTSVTHHEALLSQFFRLTHPIANSSSSANLTTQDRLSMIILVAQIVGLPRENSTADFTINYQATPDATPVNVFSKTNFTSLVPPMDVSLSWAVPQNGTYHFDVQYHFGGEAMTQVSIVRYWSANELVPTTIYMPLLADYMAPALIISSALLIVSVAIPIYQLYKIRSAKNEFYDEFTNLPPPPPPELKT